MTVLGRFLDLPPSRRRLLPEAVVAVAFAAVAVAVAPFRRIAAFAARPVGSAGAVEVERWAGEIRWAVEAVARRAPWRAKCFERGLAAQWMLRRRGVRAVLHYGLAQRPDGLKAHVWVTADGVEVVGCEISRDFAELARFPDL